tara:strand:- start:18 stop:2807 length:2790 start_codon:yes stop_codon:yes gene_type:complete
MKILTSTLQYFFPALALCLGLTAEAQTVIHTEDFETDGQGTRYTATTPFSSSANDHWNRTDGSGLQNGTGAYSSISGAYFWAAEDTDTGGTGNDEQTIDITGINITGATALEFQGLFGANSRPAGGSNYDSTDWIKVQAQIDSGGYSDVIWFAYLKEGRPSNDYTSEPLGVDRDFNREADSSTDLLGPALQSYSADISGTGSTLDIRIIVHMDGGDEEIAFDNLQILGTVSANEAITLSATPTTVDEGSTLAVTLSVPTNVDSDTVFSLTSGDDTELSIPTTATIPAGANSVNFDVSGSSDSEYDVDTAVTITASLTGYISDTLDITVVDIDTATLTAIRTEDFETDGQGTDYTASTPFSSTANDHFNRTDDSGISNVSGAYSSYSGTYFWAAEDTDDNGGDGVDEKTLNITGINIAGASALNFKGLFGAGNENGVGASNYDSTDYIKVQAQIDGGGYSEVLWFSFLDPGGSDNSNEPFGVDRDFDGAADSAEDLLGTALQPYIASISGTGSTLDLRIQVHMDIGNEEIAFDNIQILGLVSEAITLSATPTTVDEDSTLAVTLSVPTSVSTDTTFVLSSDGDNSELSIPTTVTVPTGASSVDFNISGLSDEVYDGNQDLTITAELAGYISGTLDITVVDTDSRPPLGNIIFTQYYDGTSSNKWVEISNIGESSVDLSSYEIALWGGSASPEDWKTDGGTPFKTLSLSGVTLAAGESYLIANSSAALPFSSDLADETSEITFFNGNDSLVLYSDPTGYLVSNILDAISFTVAKEGEERGFVRTSASYGFDFNSGSSIEDYDDDNSGPAVWTQITTAAADAAVDGDDAYLGSTGLVTAADPVAEYLTAISFGIVYDGTTLALTLTSDSQSEPSGITVTLQATSDLSVAFANVASTISVVDNTDGTYTRSYTETSPPADALQRFLRLSITTD